MHHAHFKMKKLVTIFQNFIMKRKAVLNKEYYNLVLLILEGFYLTAAKFDVKRRRTRSLIVSAKCVEKCRKCARAPSALDLLRKF